MHGGKHGKCSGPLFTLELLTQRGKEYHSVERWGVIPKNSNQNQSIYFRPTENSASVLDRKSEWNMLMHFRMPFMFNVPLEKSRVLLGKIIFSSFKLGQRFSTKTVKKV